MSLPIVGGNAAMADAGAFTDPTAPVGGTVPPTLSLTLGTPASFGAFIPGVGQTYTASTTATVTSTAGEATSASPTRAAEHGPPGQRHVRPAAAAAGPGPQRRQHRHRLQQRRLVGLAAEPAVLHGPVSNGAVTLGFSQRINNTDALRTGAYSKTLTFTLSTTQP